MIVLYPILSGWEYTYIKNEILNNDNKFSYFKYNNFNEILEYNFSNQNKFIFIFSTNMITNKLIYDIILKIFTQLSPLIIISLSDEFGNHKYLNDLTKNAKLYLHCYNHMNYIYNSNSYHIPLGYICNYLSENHKFESIQNKLFSIDNRNIDCSFVGEIKSDRQHMLDIFNNSKLKCNFVNGKNSWNEMNQIIKPNNLFDIYNNSIFVLIGRGNISLNCFRIYEAITAGAIPLLVGEKTEIINTFNFNGDKPYLIYDNTWELVLNKCLLLLNNKQMLQQIQKININWWINKVKYINNLVEKALE